MPQKDISQMERKPLVSVIVPVYNAGKYLEDCVNSIIDQSYDKLEILFIDDGSTDGSGGICDDYGEKDPRINVFHQENSGAAAARKKGIQLASGEYVCFVDADDRINKDMIASFVNYIGTCDILTSGAGCEDAPGKYHMRMDSFREGIYDTKEAMEYFIANMISYENRFEDGVLPFLVNKMYRAELIKEAVQDIDPSIIYAEDRDLLFRCILKASSIRVIHQIFYDYRYNADSIMRTVNKNFMSDLNKLYLSLEKVFEKHPQRECLLHQLQLFILSRIYAIPHFMNFFPDIQVAGAVFPFSELEKGSRIILYGAGTVGLCYYRQVLRQKLLQLVLWADKDWKDFEDKPLPVSAPKRIMESEYDYLVIAVKRKELAEEIRKELMEAGVREDRILWRPPAVL